MADSNVGSLLTQKWGGVPVWAILGGAVVVGGGIIYYINSRQAKPASSDQSQAAAGNASSMYAVPPVTYVTGIPDTTTGLNSQSSTGAASPETVTAGSGVPGGGDPTGIFRTPGTSSVITTVPKGTVLQVAGAPVQGDSFTFGNITSSSWTPVKISGGGTGYVWSPFVGVGMGGGMGGGMTPWEGFAQRHRMPTYIMGGLGGGGGAGGNLSHIAKKARVPHARLQALNPQLRRTGGRVGPSQLVRIA